VEKEPEIARVVGEMKGTISAYLFGSFAEGREHRESDVDVGVLLDRSAYPTERARFEVRLLLGTRIADVVGRSADVVILNDVPPLFARAVVTRGRRIYCSDPEADHGFVRDAQLRAADVEPFVRRMRGIALETTRR
jgi:uncharacterized protein